MDSAPFVVALLALASALSLAAFIVSLTVCSGCSQSSSAERSQSKGGTVLVTLTDKNYLEKFERTIAQARDVGTWTGDIVCIATKDAFGDRTFRAICGKHNVEPFHAQAFDTSRIVQHIKANPFAQSDGRELRKLVQWEKMHVFDPFFAKRWSRVFYIDAGLSIYSDLSKFTTALPAETGGMLYAHSDAFPTYANTLRCQFDANGGKNEALREKLENQFNLAADYFQTCVLVFDPRAIPVTAKDELQRIMNAYPICRTNEQALCNLYFSGRWKQLPIADDEGHLLYDFHRRKKGSKYVMLKY